MSITFFFPTDQTYTERYDCMTCAPSALYKSMHDEPCPECHGKGHVEFPSYVHEVNMSNGNAFRVMKALGFGKDMDYCGSIDAFEMFGACYLYDAGGLQDDYVDRRVADLFKLARACLKAGCDEITWC